MKLTPAGKRVVIGKGTGKGRTAVRIERAQAGRSTTRKESQKMEQASKPVTITRSGRKVVKTVQFNIKKN